MRLFIAATFPVEVLRGVNERVAGLKSRLPPASWVRAESQHLTFAFLGEQPESLVETLTTPLTNALAGISPFDARLRGSGFFPNARHARVGWIGLEPEHEFVNVARAVRDVASANGVALDGDFKAHLTMMRMREGWPPASIDLFTRSLRDYESPSFHVEAVTLFSSRLDPRGAVHTPLRVFAL